MADEPSTRRTSTTCSSSARAARGCARRSRRAPRGLSVGLVCKSLLGKAHTVMAEGGVAAALGYVEPKDNWKVHFRDTMKGGRYLNQWRMAQLHAMEAPDRVKELEEWGALFDRTADGRILQRNFGGHKYPRLAHVGDRTGPRDDPHAPAARHPLRDAGVHGVHDHARCSRRRASRVRGASATGARTAASSSSTPSRSSSRPGGIGRAFRINSNSWECTGDGQALAYLAGAELMDMEFMQFHPTGMVWPPSVRGTLITEGVRGEGGTLRNKDGKRIMFGYIPELYANETASTEEEADQWLRESTSGDASKARRTPDLLPRDIVARAIHTRGEGGSRQPARRRLPRHLLAPQRRGHQAEAPGDVPPVQGAGRRRHHQGADGGRADGALHDGRHPRRPGDAGVAHQGPLRRRRVRGGDARREPPRRQLAVGPARLRAHRRASTRRSTRRRRGAAGARRRRDRRGHARGARAVRSRRRAEPVSPPRGPEGQDADATSASSAPRRT